MLEAFPCLPRPARPPRAPRKDIYALTLVYAHLRDALPGRQKVAGPHFGMAQTLVVYRQIAAINILAASLAVCRAVDPLTTSRATSTRCVSSCLHRQLPTLASIIDKDSNHAPNLRTLSNPEFPQPQFATTVIFRYGAIRERENG